MSTIVVSNFFLFLWKLSQDVTKRSSSEISKCKNAKYDQTNLSPIVQPKSHTKRSHLTTGQMRIEQARSLSYPVQPPREGGQLDGLGFFPVGGRKNGRKWAKISRHWAWLAMGYWWVRVGQHPFPANPMSQHPSRNPPGGLSSNVLYPQSSPMEMLCCAPHCRGKEECTGLQKKTQHIIFNVHNILLFLKINKKY